VVPVRQRAWHDPGKRVLIGKLRTGGKKVGFGGGREAAIRGKRRKIRTCTTLRKKLVHRKGLQDTGKALAETGNERENGSRGNHEEKHTFSRRKKGRSAHSTQLEKLEESFPLRE